MLLTPYKFLYIVLLKLALFPGETYDPSVFYMVTLMVGSCYYWFALALLSVSSSIFIKCLLCLYLFYFGAPIEIEVLCIDGTWVGSILDLFSDWELETIVSKRLLSIWSTFIVAWAWFRDLDSSFDVFSGVMMISLIGSFFNV